MILSHDCESGPKLCPLTLLVSASCPVLVHRLAT